MTNDHLALLESAVLVPSSWSSTSSIALGTTKTTAVNSIGASTSSARLKKELIWNRNDDGDNYDRNYHYHPMNMTILKKHPLMVADCGAKGTNHSFLFAGKVIYGWICKVKSEQAVTAVMRYVFSGAAVPGGKIMLDVGANMGYYGLLAARYGHYAVAFDLQPECIHAIYNSVLANNFGNRLSIIHSGVSNKHGNFTVPKYSGCDGQFPMNEKAMANNQKQETVQVQMHPLDYFFTSTSSQENEVEGDEEELVLPEIMLMKVDTEGNEKRVLDGAMRFFRHKRVLNAIVELTPGYNFWERNGITAMSVIDTLTEIVEQHGYAMISLHDWQIVRTRQEIEVCVLSRTKCPGQFDVWLVLQETVQGVGNVFNSTSILTSHK